MMRGAARLALAIGIAAPAAAAAPSCPAEAVVAVRVVNHSADDVLVLQLEGELLDEAATCAGSGDTRYESVVTCVGKGRVDCGRIGHLRPGAWANRVRVTVRGSAEQAQAQQAIFLGETQPAVSNVLIWTVYSRTFVVSEATQQALRTQIDAAGLCSRSDPTCHPLVRFDRGTFPGAHAPVRIPMSVPDCRTQCTGIRMEGSGIVVDALDGKGEPGGVLLSAGAEGQSVLRILGSGNVIRGLVLEGSRRVGEPATPGGRPPQWDTLRFDVGQANNNRVERSVVVGPAEGDAVSGQFGAGQEAPNVIETTEILGAHDKGVKVTTGARLEIRRSCVHDNEDGGVQSTLGGDVVAVENIVQHNVPGQAQNGLSAGGVPDDPDDMGLLSTQRSLLRTFGNIVRYAGARGLSVVDNAQGDFRDDYVADNQFAGARVESIRQGAMAQARFRGVAFVCNHNEGITGRCALDSAVTCVPHAECCCDVDASCAGTDCCDSRDACCSSDPTCAASVRCDVALQGRAHGFGSVHDKCPACSAPDVDYGADGEPGRNAFVLNGNPASGAEGANLHHAVPNAIALRGNQWEHCGSGATCDVESIRRGDIRLASGATVDLDSGPGHRAGRPVLVRVSPPRPQAGELVRLYGDNFNAIDGAACAHEVVPRDPCSAANAAVAARNECGGPGNCVELLFDGAPLFVDVAAATPTMLAFIMPIDCFAPATVRVSRRTVSGGTESATIAVCDPMHCVTRPEGTPCDDGNVCTTGDRCVADECLGSGERTCEGACLSGSCDATRGCQPAPATEPCDDGDACTVDDHCHGDTSVCMSGRPRECVGPCVSGTCDTMRGCLPATAGTSCDDGDPCSVGDRCDGGARCLPGEPAACRGACLTGECRRGGGCVPRTGGTVCDDGNACTVGDRCRGDGDVCLPGAPLSCVGPCLTGVCDEAIGCLRAAAGTPCNDGDPCSVADRCDGAVTCVPGELLRCEGMCLTGVCLAGHGCLAQPATVACDDGDACSVNDHCRGDGDVCVPGSPRSCEATCLTGGCDPSLGCLPEPDGTPCDDGRHCTIADRCDGDGGCSGGDRRDCDDQDACTDDECSETLGCTHRPRLGFEGIDCQTGMLTRAVVDALRGQPALRRMERLLARVSRHTEAARMANDEARRRPARNRLRRASREMRRFLGHLRRQRTLPAEVHQHLRDAALRAMTQIDERRRALGRGS
jgi:hypothetical protein